VNGTNEEHRYSETHVLAEECECRVCGKRERRIDVMVVEMEVPSQKLISWECSEGHHNHIEIFAGEVDWSDPVKRTQV
jgi:hypothetical protein